MIGKENLEQRKTTKKNEKHELLEKEPKGFENDIRSNLLEEKHEVISVQNRRLMPQMLSLKANVRLLTPDATRGHLQAALLHKKEETRRTDRIGREKNHMGHAEHRLLPKVN